jgi:predicted DNA-binding antitoxin AbrB/MazE fold protein
MVLRAVYERGYLRLLDPIKLNEGQEVRVTVQQEANRDALTEADLLVADFDFDVVPQAISPEEQDRLASVFANERSVLDDIQEDRGEF